MNIADLNICFDINDEIYLSKKVLIAYLKVDKVLIIVFYKCVNFADIFSLKLVVELPKHMRNNNYFMELIDHNNFYIALFIA